MAVFHPVAAGGDLHPSPSRLTSAVQPISNCQNSPHTPSSFNMKQTSFNDNYYYVSPFGNDSYQNLRLSLDTGKGLGKLPFLNLY